MDVVANKVAELGGNLRIESILGEGTEIIMEIPLIDGMWTVMLQ